MTQARVKDAEDPWFTNATRIDNLAEKINDEMSPLTARMVDLEMQRIHAKADRIIKQFAARRESDEVFIPAGWVEHEHHFPPVQSGGKTQILPIQLSQKPQMHGNASFYIPGKTGQDAKKTQKSQRAQDSDVPKPKGNEGKPDDVEGTGKGPDRP